VTETLEAVETPAEEIAASPAVGRQVGVSAVWSAANAGILRVATFVVTLVMAHLVAPYDFGVFTVAITVFMITMSISELGVASALVREHNRSRELAPTVFTISLLNGTFHALLMVVFAPVFARELGSANAASAIRVLSLVVLLSGFSAVPAALMSRDFMQRERFITDAAFFVSSTAIMLVLVLAGHPIMGLAFSRVAGQLVTVILIVWMSPEKYWPGFRLPEAKHLMAFGLPLAGANLLTMITANVDFIIVGHIMGPRHLGYYNLAFGIASWPVTIFSAVLISVTLPTLSRVRHSTVHLRRHLEAGLSAVVAASFPVCALLCALSGPLISTVYGTRWHPAWTALVILAVFGAARTVLTLFSDLTVALGMTKRLLLIQTLWLVVLTPLMIFSVAHWGIGGAGIAHAVVIALLVIPLYLITVRKRTSVGLAWVRRGMLRPFLASVGAAVAAYGATRLVDGNALKLLLGIAVGSVTYVGLAGPWLLRVKATLHDMYWRQSPTQPRAGTGRHRALERAAQ
jgi:PST family polysaccharide transporter